MSAAEYFFPCILIKQQTSSFRVKRSSVVFYTTLVNNCWCGHFLLNSYVTWYQYILAPERWWGLGNMPCFHLKEVTVLISIWAILFKVSNDKIWLKTWLSKHCFLEFSSYQFSGQFEEWGKLFYKTFYLVAACRKEHWRRWGGEFIKWNSFRDLFDQCDIKVQRWPGPKNMLSWTSNIAFLTAVCEEIEQAAKCQDSLSWRYLKNM